MLLRKGLDGSDRLLRLIDPDRIDEVLAQRDQLPAGLPEGGVLLARFDDDEIKLVTPEATARKIQAAVRKFVPEGVSLVDELLKERRREAAHEQGDA